MRSLLSIISIIELLLLCVGIQSCVPIQPSSPTDVQTISGRVLEGDIPVADAVVRVQATTISDISDTGGKFELTGITGTESLMIAAWKMGFYIGGTEARPGEQDVIISLQRYPERDYEFYAWISPEPPPEERLNCSKCHEAAVTQWKSNLHSQAAVDPLVLMMYNGTDMNGNSDVEPGFRLDFPGAAGSCANCHAPTASLVGGSWTTDLNDVSGVDRNGVFCDYCHKIIATKVDPYGSSPGFLSIELRRPDPTTQLFFGTIDDTPRRASYHQLYKKSVYCAPCHQYYNNRVPIYSSYPEWTTSPYAAEGVECQDCHMKPDGVTTNVAPNAGGIERDPMTLPSHLQMGAEERLFIAEALALSTIVTVDDNVLGVEVSIENKGAGHHIPTGNPMRNMILTVDAQDQDGTALPYLGDDRVPDWAGLGSEPNDYAGRPGKGFAKILEDQHGNSPAPQWRVAFIKSDSRIPARRIDISRYSFEIPKGTEEIYLNTKLIYRKTFKPWADAKGWPMADYLVRVNTMRFRCSESQHSDSISCVPIAD